MSGIRPIIDDAVADVIATHPKYFTPKGHEHARDMIVRKIMAAIRGDGSKPGESDAAPASPAQPIAVEPLSREGRAYTVLRELAGAPAPFRMSGNLISLPPEANNVRVMALADLSKREHWEFLTAVKQIGAWTEFFREMLPAGPPRRSIVETRGDQTGILMPWTWPPARDGKIYVAQSEIEESEADA